MNRGAGGVGELTSYVISCVIDNVPPSVRWRVTIDGATLDRECVRLSLWVKDHAMSHIQLTTTDVMHAGGAGNFIVSLGARIRSLLALPPHP